MTFRKIIASAAAVYLPAMLRLYILEEIKDDSKLLKALILTKPQIDTQDKYFFPDYSKSQFITTFSGNAVKNFSGYKLGEYFVGDDASLTKTIIASAIGGAVIQTTLNAFIFEIAFENMSFKSFLSFFFKNIIEIPVSSGLLAYINYEDSDKASELDTDNIDQQDI